MKYTIFYYNIDRTERYHVSQNSYLDAIHDAQWYKKRYPGRDAYVVDNTTGEIVWGV